jgi:HK97 family phage portal protein
MPVWFSNLGTLGTTDPRLGSAFASGGVKVSEFRTLDNRALYTQNVWVNVMVNLIARAVAKTPMKAYQDGTDTTPDRERLRSRGANAHPLASVIERPWRGGTQFRLKNALVVEYLVNPNGKAYVWMDREGRPSGLPKRLIPMRSSQLTAQYDRSGRVAFYEWREQPGADPTARILPDDMLVVGFEDGVSPLSALAKTLEIDIASQQTTASFYKNGAHVGTIFTTEKPLKPDAVETIEAKLRSDHKGPENAFRTLVLANMPGAEMHNLGGVNSSDAQTVEHRKLAREEVAAAFHVPQPIAGILDRATFSNIETQTRMWVVDTLGEHFAMIESAFNGQLVDAHDEWADCFVEFDPGEILRGAPTQRAETYLKWLNSGTRTPNEMRRLENLPDIPDDWANAIYIPANLVPAGLPGGASGTPQNGASPDGRVRMAQPLPDVALWGGTDLAAAAVDDGGAS